MYQTRYHFVPQTTSTNDEARDPRYSHGDMIRTEFQTAGRGQRGHVWTSPRGENLIVSIVWEPVFLPASQQFLISEAVSLALVDTMALYGIEASIKWTNDIYVGDRKLVGTLIENNLSGGNIARSIPGIGINVNQTEFDPSLPNPCSMRQILSRVSCSIVWRLRWLRVTTSWKTAIGRPCRPTTARICIAWTRSIRTVIRTGGRLWPYCAVYALRENFCSISRTAGRRVFSSRRSNL